MSKPELTARVEQFEYENKRMALDLRKTGAERYTEDHYEAPDGKETE